jgi:hypothetical protein
VKKILIGVLVICATGFSYAAESKGTGLCVNVWGGYATVDMAEMNNLLDAFAIELKSEAESYGGISATPEVTKFSGALTGGLDLGYKITDSVLLGVRGGYLSCTQAKASVSATEGAYTGSIAAKADVSLIPVMAGGSVNVEVTKGISVGVNLYAGYGMLSSKLVKSYETNMPGMVLPANEETSMYSAGFVGDFSAGITLAVTEGISINVTGGYNLASFSEIKYSADDVANGIVKDTVVTGMDSLPLKINLSGIVGRAGIAFTF